MSGVHFIDCASGWTQALKSSDYNFILPSQLQVYKDIDCIHNYLCLFSNAYFPWSNDAISNNSNERLIENSLRSEKVIKRIVFLFFGSEKWGTLNPIQPFSKLQSMISVKIDIFSHKMHVSAAFQWYFGHYFCFYRP